MSCTNDKEFIFEYRTPESNCTIVLKARDLTHAIGLFRWRFGTYAEIIEIREE